MRIPKEGLNNNWRLVLLVSLCAGCWANVAALAAPVTFQVDMSAQIALGNFRPEIDTVTVAGDPLNGWSPTASELVESAATPGIWTGTFEIEALADTVVNYKFVINTPEAAVWEGNVGPGGGNGNRVFTLDAAGQTLPVG